jgi:hypothetical protein
MELTKELLLNRRAQLTTALSELSGAQAMIDEMIEVLETVTPDGGNTDAEVENGAKD